MTHCHITVKFCSCISSPGVLLHQPFQQQAMHVWQTMDSYSFSCIHILWIFALITKLEYWLIHMRAHLSLIGQVSQQRTHFPIKTAVSFLCGLFGCYCYCKLWYAFCIQICNIEQCFPNFWFKPKIVLWLLWWAALIWLQRKSSLPLLCIYVHMHIYFN